MTEREAAGGRTSRPRRGCGAGGFGAISTRRSPRSRPRCRSTGGCTARTFSAASPTRRCSVGAGSCRPRMRSRWSAGSARSSRRSTPGCSGSPARRTSTRSSRPTLRARIGDPAGRLHTARSRNDQVATDLRYYLKGEIVKIVGRTVALEQVLLALAETHPSVIIPGYTHLQRAQPVLLAHHLLAYLWMLPRDVGRFRDAFAARRRAARSAPPRSRAPRIRSTARSWRRSWGSRASPRTAWTPRPTATSPSRRPPPPRC